MSNPTNRPIFHHPEIEILYEHDFTIPRANVEAILQLPRETLIQDLRRIVQDAIERYPYFRDRDFIREEREFVLHALWLLADLKAEEALPDVFDLLRQEQPFLEWWFGDLLTESLWEVVYHLGDRSLDQLKTFVMEGGTYPFARTVPGDAVEQIALHQPERRDEAIEWFGSLYEYFLNLEADDPAMDRDAISVLAANAIHFKGESLLPLIKKLDDRGLIIHDLVGDYHSIQRSMEESDGSGGFHKREVFSNVFERYHEAVTTWHYYRMEYDEDYRKRRPPASKTSPAEANASLIHDAASGTFQRAGKKVGRNDPCPCGSGSRFSLPRGANFQAANRSVSRVSRALFDRSSSRNMAASPREAGSC